MSARSIPLQRLMNQKYPFYLVLRKLDRYYLRPLCPISFVGREQDDLATGSDQKPVEHDILHMM